MRYVSLEVRCDVFGVRAARLVYAVLMRLHTDYLLRIRQSVLLRARVLRLELYFPKPRRGTDHLLIALNGSKENVLRIPNYLFDTFEKIDIELIRSEETDGVYRILLAVTKKLDAQGSTPSEKRSKLQRRMWREADLEKPTQRLNV